MKRQKIAGLITTGLLAAGVALADDKDRDINKGSPVEDKARDVGQGVKGTAEKIQQGAKNIFADIKFEELPQAVQKTVTEQAKGAKIADIDREDRTGRTIYEIEFESPTGEDREIHVAADGTLLTAEQAGLALGWDTDDKDRTRVRDTADRKKLKYADLPVAVQTRISQEGAVDQIADIDRYNRNGKVVYEVEFRRDGFNREIHVGEDGKLIDVDAIGAPGRDNGVGTDTDVEKRERTLPPSGAGTVPNPTLEPTDVK